MPDHVGLRLMQTSRNGWRETVVDSCPPVNGDDREPIAKLPVLLCSWKYRQVKPSVTKRTAES